MSAKSLRLLPFLLFGTATDASAAEGGLLTPSSGLMFWTILTFVVVLVVLWKMALPPILSAVEAREQQIRDLIAEAERDREAAQAALAEQTHLLEETRASVQDLVAEGRTAGERVRDEVIAEARRTAEEIATRARREVRQELDSALQELRLEAVDLAMAAAGKLVDRNLDSDDNRRLVRDYLEDLSAESAAAAGAGA
ncbi:MAG: F0F1 ATP synthase subunit B [Gemmatimonadota bacterium]